MMALISRGIYVEHIHTDWTMTGLPLTGTFAKTKFLEISRAGLKLNRATQHRLDIGKKKKKCLLDQPSVP